MGPIPGISAARRLNTHHLAGDIGHLEGQGKLSKDLLLRPVPGGSVLVLDGLVAARIAPGLENLEGFGIAPVQAKAGLPGYALQVVRAGVIVEPLVQSGKIVAPSLARPQAGCLRAAAGAGHELQVLHILAGRPATSSATGRWYCLPRRVGSSTRIE